MFYGCVQKSDKKELIAIEATQEIDVDLSEIIDSVSFYPLETDVKCLIGPFHSAALKDDHIFVQDNKRLYLFDLNGNFVSNIGRIGNGPGEYLHFDTFYVDEDTDVVGVVCGYKKSIMCYDYNGNYLYSIKLDKADAEVINKIILLPDGRMLAHYVLPGDVFPNESIYKLFTVKGDRIVAESLCKPSLYNIGREGIHPYMYHSMTMYQGECLALNPVSLDISCLDEADLFPKYRVNMGKELPDESYVKNNWTGDVIGFVINLQKEGRSPGLLDIFSNGKYLLLRQDYNGNTLVWDGYEAILLGRVSHMEYNLMSGGLASGLSPDYLGHHSSHDGESNPVLYLYHFRDDLMDVLKAKK